MEASQEFRLVAECCRWAFAGGDDAAVCALCRNVDWPLVVRLARFHRVQGLAWKTLAPLAANFPPEAGRALSDDAADIAATNLRCAVESRRVLAVFAKGGVELLFIKGLTLGALAYGGSGTKAAIDIDLLVSRDQVEQAAALLIDCGYDLEIPRRGVDRLSSWHRLRKESVWRQAGGGLQIDLHTRLADNPRLIETIDIASPSQVVQVAEGIALPTLAPDELFAYLCVHGASSAWFRLKWITDVVALLQRSSGQVERLYRRSQELGAGRAAAQALLLADAIYGTLSDFPELRRELKTDRANRRLCRLSLEQLAGREEPVEPTSVTGGTAVIHLSQLLLLPGLRFKAGELIRQARLAIG
jgi:hypothetical protein